MSNIAYESDSLEKLDDLADVFSDIDPQNPPTMRQALEDMEIPEKIIEQTMDDLGYFVEFRQEKKVLPKKLPMSLDELNAIYCYSKGGLDDDETISLFSMVNKALYTKEGKREIVKKYRKFLYLFLSGIRKLPRTIPVDDILYRGLKTYVTMEDNGADAPYAVDRVKTWWGFTSTSADERSAVPFLKDHNAENFGTGTMFIIRGRVWGYDISPYVFYEGEREFLIEPEQKMKVVSISEKKGVYYVNVEMLESDLPLTKLIPPKETEARPPKEPPIDSSIGLPRGFWAEKVWWNGAELSWNNVEIHGVYYQIGLAGNFFFSSVKPILKTTRLSCELKDLEPQKKYNFCIRAGDGKAWGKWSTTLTFETPPLNPPERFLVKNVMYNELEISWGEVHSAPFIRTTYRVEAESENGTKEIVYEGTECRFRKTLKDKEVLKLRVQAGVDSRWSAWSQDVKGKWENIAIPSNVTANLENKKVCIVTWNKVSGRNITYQVAVSVNGSAEPVISSPLKELRYEYESEVEMNSLKVKVRTIKDNVSGKWSDEITA